MPTRYNGNPKQEVHVGAGGFGDGNINSYRLSARRISPSEIIDFATNPKTHRAAIPGK